MALPEPYQSLLTLSERMASLAQEQNWDQLTTLEEEYLALSAKLPAKFPALSPTESSALTTAMQRILECNAIISAHVSPWMEHAGTLLAALAPKA